MNRSSTAIDALDRQALAAHVAEALEEDFRGSDITSAAILGHDVAARAQLISREEGVLCGIPVAAQVFASVDPRLRLSVRMSDGERLNPGAVAFEVSGAATSILAAERTALNYLQHLSGVATETARYVEVAHRYEVTILDTRKTAPGLRRLEKYATAVGGARNHRMGLFDAVLIKDNHVDLSGGMSEALARALRRFSPGQVQVEVRDLEELSEALRAGVGWVLLDNFTTAQVEEALRLIDHRAQVEVSGGIDLSNLEAYAACRPDFISVGRLTHSVRALDLALKVLAST